jgi:three-Cys-motif partner protein
VTKTDFFKEPKEHSVAKMEIVAKYFSAWANIMKERCRVLSYLDLFSGRGKYKDGTPATPLRIMDRISGLRGVESRLRITFYEKSQTHYSVLKNLVEQHPACARLHFKPEVFRKEVGSRLLHELPKDDCTFCFIDPCGYRGISLELLNAVIRNWGCDCLLYLSVSGLRRNLEREEQIEHVEAIFGEEGLGRLRENLSSGDQKTSFSRLVIAELRKAINKQQSTYVLPFGIEFEKRRLVSHFLVFLCKNPLGFSIMKQIMYNYSKLDPAGIPYYKYPSHKDRVSGQQELLISQRMKALERSLCAHFAGRLHSVKQVIDHCDRLGMLCVPRNIESHFLILRCLEESVCLCRLTKRERRGE